MKILRLLFPAIAIMFFFETTLAVSCPEINRGSHPYGLNHAAFNCYTDNYWLDDNFGGGEREQDFVRVEKNNVGGFSNSVSLTKGGDVALVMMYFHNSGQEDQYPANNGVISLDWSNPSNIKGQVTASNTNPISVDDSVAINLGDNLLLHPMALYYKGTKIKDLAADSTRTRFTFESFGSSYKHAKYFYVSFAAIKSTPKNPKISVAKVDMNPELDQDGVDGSKEPNIEFDNENKTVFEADDSQTIQKGKTSKFKIIVKNTGDVELTDVVLTDAKASGCNRTGTQTLALYPGNTFDPGESFEYFCARRNIQVGYVNEIMVSAKAGGKLVGSGDRSEVLIEDKRKNPKISVAKVDINAGVDQDGIDGSGKPNIEFDNANKTVFGAEDSQTLSKGETSKFKIIVKNTGDLKLTDVELTDANASACNKTAVQTLVLYDGNTFDPRESFHYLCERLNIQAGYVNEVMVSAKANGEPIESKDRSEVLITTNNGFCGDGVKDEGEACDDGNDIDTDTCSSTCKFTTCGDGIVQSPNGFGQVEECDDGVNNGAPKSTCSATCTVGGGGGGAPVVSSIGTCSVNPTGTWQCQGRKPYRNGEGWDDYRLCKEGNGGFDITRIIGGTIEQKCVTAWAQFMNLDTCGNAGDSASNNATNCNPLPPSGPGIIPNTPTCPGCFKASSFITKSANKTKIARGDEVAYNLKLELGLSDLVHYRVVDAKVKFYDFTIPAQGGNLWGRNGLSAGWSEAPAGGGYFEKRFGTGSNVVANMNTHGGAVIDMNYRMNSSLASDADTASIDNVAFAVVDYAYRNIGCNPTSPGCGDINTQKVLLAAEGQSTARALAIWQSQRQNASYSSMGDTASIEVIRPFVRASNGGNLGFEFKSDRTEKVTATDENQLGTFTTGEIFVDDNGTDHSLFDFNGYEVIDNIDPLKQFQTNNINEYYKNLKFNAVNVTQLGKSFLKPLTQEVYFLESGSLLLNGTLDLEGKDKTFIIENGDLNIGAGGIKLINGFAGFIVRNGDIVVDKATTHMEGIYIAETKEIRSKNDEISRQQLQVLGALMGDLEPLLNKRWYIGTNPETLLEPNIEIEFDLRLLENTPPTLEQFLGDDWQEDVR